MPARYEPFGLSALEAGLAGCALVLGDIPSLREIWHGAAVFVDSDDSEHLKFSLQKLMHTPTRIHELATFAQCRAIQFTPKRMAGEFFKAYREIMAAGTNVPKKVLTCGKPDSITHSQ